MSTKRKDNKGRILRDGEIQKSDGRYEYRYYDVDGIRRSIYSWKLTAVDSLPAGKRDCTPLRDLERSITRDVQDGIRSYNHDSLTDRWNQYIRSKRNLKIASLDNYQHIYNLYVRDEIGDRKVSDLKYSKMLEYFNRLSQTYELKPASIEHVYAILNPVFKIAVRDGLIRINPLYGLLSDLKNTVDWEKEPRHSLTEAQQIAFISFVKLDPRFSIWYNFFVCLLGTGCRIGEMTGLRWTDIYWEENLISINHSLRRRTHPGIASSLYISTPKTEKGNRFIPMFTSVRNALQNEYERQLEDGFCRASVDGFKDFVWHQPSGDLIDAHRANNVIDQVVRAYNAKETELAKIEDRSPILLPRFTPHQLRHTFCTRLCERERDLKLIQEIMGHANIATTMDIYNESNIDRKIASFARLEQEHGDIF